ncbi:hypothetical protein C5167_014006 [Papaver somniferum]|uniref:Uncharacterized protein n=1 Tax=Papaver somniferum TaxID=3469 RepID=A0A4Y7J2X0_PAPSO|nr:hypothetical protein C5167_014006 [Papaver somniferum]
MMALQLLLTVIDIPLVFAMSLLWGLILFLMAFWDAGNVRGLCRHSPFVRPHMVFIGVYFSLSRLVNSYCTSAGNAYLQLLKVKCGQILSKQREILLAVLPASISNVSSHFYLHTTGTNFQFASLRVFPLRWKLAADNDAQPNDILERSPGQVTLWLTVKDCIGSQFLRARIMKGQLASLLISEASYIFGNDTGRTGASATYTKGYQALYRSRE